MKTLYTQTEYDNARYKDKLALECFYCKKNFLREKSAIRKILLGQKTKSSCKYCSKNCRYEDQITKVTVLCKNCNKIFQKKKNQAIKYTNHFCSHSCSATYSNKHKTTGTRRSKLEVWLETQLQISYPNLGILYNNKKTIGSELDIYIPSLSLAFELNGIFHYEPIYGDKKLSQIQNNDKGKFQACLLNKIELCIIDVSGLKYFKPQKAKCFLDIIESIISMKKQ